MTVTDRTEMASCCDEWCQFRGVDDEEPCWGEVTVVDEEWNDDGDWWWIHACEGHAPLQSGDQYRQRPEAPVCATTPTT